MSKVIPLGAAIANLPTRLEYEGPTRRLFLRGFRTLPLAAIAGPLLSNVRLMAEPAPVRESFAGVWRQNNDRCVPTPKNKNRSYTMNVEVEDGWLRVRITTNRNGQDRTLDLKYELGGRELVYTGLDGDEFHSTAHAEASKIVFDIVERERGKTIVSKETWTLIDSGKALQRTKESGDGDEPAKVVYVLERM